MTPGKRIRSRTIFDAGTGKHPLAIVKLAAQSENKNKKRTFVGADIEKFEEEEVKKALNLKQLPKNLKLLGETDAIEEVKRMKPSSQDIIFGSYFLNNATRNGSIAQAISEFLHYSMKAIKPSGRVIIILDKEITYPIAHLAMNFGFKTHTIELSDAQAKVSSLEAVRRRSTPEKRQQFLKSIGQNATPAEGARPTIIMLRKPLKEGFVERFIRTQKGKVIVKTAQRLTHSR